MICCFIVLFVFFFVKFSSHSYYFTGPQCVLSCAKEHRVLPKQGFTCCLAMDGVKVLASGFEKDEKVYFAYCSTDFFTIFAAYMLINTGNILISLPDHNVFPIFQNSLLLT
jgi:hypothetical protein